MLYIVRGPLDENTIGWHVGDVSLKEINVTNVTEVQADCDELEYIRERFPGLVIPNKRVVRWYGETAKFIAGNL